MIVRARLTQGVLYGILGSVASRGAVLIANLIAARTLGPGSYGRCGLVLATVAMLAVVAGLGLGVTATRTIAHYRIIDNNRACQSLAFLRAVAMASGLTATVAILALPNQLSGALIGDRSFGPLFISACAYPLVSALSTTLTGAVVGLEAFRFLALANTVGAVAALPLIAFAVSGWGEPGYLLAVSIAPIATYVMLEIAVGKRLSRSWAVRKLDRSHSSVVWKFALPALLSGLVATVGNWGGTAILFALGDGGAQVGFYNAANQWFMAVVFLPGVLGQVLLPILTSKLATRSQEGHRLVRATVVLNLLCSAPFIVTACLLDDSIMSLFGPEFSSQASLISINSVAASLVAIQTPVGQMMMARGQVWMALGVNVVWSVVFVVVALGLSPWGALGVAWARCIAYAALLGCSWHFSSRLRCESGTA